MSTPSDTSCKLTLNQLKERLKLALQAVYGDSSATIYEKVVAIAEDFSKRRANSQGNGFKSLSQKDMALICYADHVVSTEFSPIQTLGKVLKEYGISDKLPITHILPFYPWDTDRGFSVKDYYSVNPGYGTWEDIKELGTYTKLMFDFVANHASIENPLVQKALISDHISPEDSECKEYLPYKDFVISYTEDNKPSEEDLKQLSRPRNFPVLTKYRVVKNDENRKVAILGEKKEEENVLGEGYVWTTFSRAKLDDGSEETCQIDINYNNPNVFVESVKILLFYVEQSAKLVRLDAIGYIWKKIGSSSLHEPECHKILEALGSVLRIAAPEVITISEVNEPQVNAFTYIGNKEHPEADLAYQFSHFPLAVHAVLTEQSNFYQEWLKTISVFGAHQFTTVLGSHDGIGMKPARGLLPEEELERLCKILVEEHQGKPNFAVLPGGKKIIYEVCATPWCIINNPHTNENFDTQLQRYLAVTAMGLCIPGIPAIYWNGLFGMKNYLPEGGLDENRTVNREIFDYIALKDLLDNETSEIHRCFQAVKYLLATRAKEQAFHPHTKLTPVVNDSSQVVSCLLDYAAENSQILAVTNVAKQQCKITLDSKDLPTNTSWIDLLSGNQYTIPNIELNAYQVCWLKQQR